jgi:hypothetical protein
MHQLELNWEWPFGEVRDEPDRPLVMERALRGMLVEGRPQDSLRWLFFQPHLANPRVHWFGALLLTKAGRIVYFPPAVIPAFGMSHRASRRPGSGFDVDHITLEEDWGGWHLTGTNTRHRSAVNRPGFIGDLVI